MVSSLRSASRPSSALQGGPVHDTDADRRHSQKTEPREVGRDDGHTGKEPVGEADPDSERDQLGRHVLLDDHGFDGSGDGAAWILKGLTA